MGRGAADMKGGTAASFATFAYLHRILGELKGKLTLTAVSDEETGGRWGTRYLLENHADECLGDCVLNGEPSSPTRFGSGRGRAPCNHHGPQRPARMAPIPIGAQAPPRSRRA